MGQLADPLELRRDSGDIAVCILGIQDVPQDFAHPCPDVIALGHGEEHQVRGLQPPQLLNLWAVREDAHHITLYRTCGDSVNSGEDFIRALEAAGLLIQDPKAIPSKTVPVRHAGEALHLQVAEAVVAESGLPFLRPLSPDPIGVADCPGIPLGTAVLIYASVLSQGLRRVYDDFPPGHIRRGIPQNQLFKARAVLSHIYDIVSVRYRPDSYGRQLLHDADRRRVPGRQSSGGRLLLHGMLPASIRTARLAPAVYLQAPVIVLPAVPVGEYQGACRILPAFIRHDPLDAAVPVPDLQLEDSLGVPVESGVLLPPAVGLLVAGGQRTDLLIIPVLAVPQPEAQHVLPRAQLPVQIPDLIVDGFSVIRIPRFVVIPVCLLTVEEYVRQPQAAAIEARFLYFPFFYMEGLPEQRRRVLLFVPADPPGLPVRLLQ